MVVNYAGQSQDSWSQVGKCRSTSRVRGKDTDDTRTEIA